MWTGCTFDFFDGEWRKIVDQQDPKHFSLDPYLVLERCARAAGRHAEADDIYQKGLGYQPRRGLHHAVVRRLLDLDDTGTAGVVEGARYRREVGRPCVQPVRLPPAYSVDEFVPVDLERAKLCRPASGWRELYSMIHIIAGWILIPLLVAAVTGFLNKR